MARCDQKDYLLSHLPSRSFVHPLNTQSKLINSGQVRDIDMNDTPMSQDQHRPQAMVGASDGAGIQDSPSSFPSQFFEAAQMIPDEAQVNRLSNPPSSNFLPIPKTGSDPEPVSATINVLFEGYTFFKADPIPGQMPCWRRVQRTQMSPSQFEYAVEKFQNRSQSISEAQQYLRLSEIRRTHVKQLIDEKRGVPEPQNLNQRRRGRGARKNEAYWAGYNSTDNKVRFWCEAARSFS